MRSIERQLAMWPVSVVPPLETQGLVLDINGRWHPHFFQKVSASFYSTHRISDELWRQMRAEPWRHPAQLQATFGELR